MSKTLTVNGTEYPLNQDKTVLENLEAHALKMEFHCRDGFCGACRAQLIKGQIKQINTPIASFRKGDILTCCSKADDDITLVIPLTL